MKIEMKDSGEEKYKKMRVRGEKSEGANAHFQ